MELQNIWLELELAGISLHPFFGNLIMFNQLIDPAHSSLEADDIALVSKWHEKMKREFQVDFAKPAIFFRVGYSTRTILAAPRRRLITDKL